MTFADIAEYTHFSKTTISRYFNHPDSLTLENQEKISQALEDLGYKKSTGRQTLVSKVSYVKRNWQLYVFFLMPALVLTIIFKYLPMGGLLIAFEDYNVIIGVFGSPWVGLEYFKRFLSSPDFMSYLLNTLKLSIYGLLWGFPIPIILALLLNRIRKQGIKKKIQLLIYAPNFISVIVLCGMVRMFLSPVGPMNRILGITTNWMTMPLLLILYWHWLKLPCT